jgi:hypothetical protein
MGASPAEADNARHHPRNELAGAEVTGNLPQQVCNALQQATYWKYRYTRASTILSSHEDDPAPLTEYRCQVELKGVTRQ